MTDERAVEDGWFADVPPGDVEAAAAAIRDGSAATVGEWPSLAVESGVAADEDDYYEQLHEAAVAATRAAVHEAETADDQQLIHAVRAMDDTERVANELAERVTEWAGDRYDADGTGVEYAASLADADDLDDPQLRSLAERIRDLAAEADDLRSHVERVTPEIAPNLARLAGPVLAARLIALAGGLKQLARKPAGTVQVLGAEEALFAHLRGRAPSPKHGVIYTHEAIQGTAPAHRGSAARALAGKLTIAARIDHYSGERNPELEADLRDRIERIQARDAE
ncbi:rRNA/tRNA 2'-O-methyltransferase complex protein Nop5 [Natronomonas pharaonis DSM 2160]|uniref:rRNA/tRNA 2'-O-methyltransferase complex protein Nop5 n=1 Tax=Natronomonas pharaonis (strain ATCC 35678 / DSM 2160 / CIP 103997 / JCM 8858 / NBRC 14720 / NCIMB 2260 / Gabara) TaxID=348780 RepID=A0A1U7EVP6_NATPD|nr:NOP5/NOP56 family protein [Natronomonas pharaonis]CAI49123.1 rRNA/tRNA 2'-O-methyltransferase complex protein Nop5 [Natronomonas pharaonis DSM 2160]